MGRVCYNQKTEQVIKKQELVQETRLFVHDVSISIKNGGGNTTIKIIKKKLTFIWRN